MNRRRRELLTALIALLVPLAAHAELAHIRNSGVSLSRRAVATGVAHQRREADRHSGTTVGPPRRDSEITPGIPDRHPVSRL